MCGVAGIISLNNKPIKNIEEKIKLMTKRLRHRGPDGEGFFVSENRKFALSNNRLAIVAPSEKIDLPFSKDKNKNTILSFNGEIYNYLVLRDQMKKKGINFETSTDTEVVYEFLKQNRLKNFDQLNGMWSFAFFNQEKNELLLSRDLLGERQLYYHIDENELIFSSEVEPILYVKSGINELDFESVKTSWKFNASGTHKTLIKNIFRLRPGTNLTCSKGKIKIERFQKLNIEKWLKYFNKLPSKKEVNKKFEEIFSKEIKLRFPTDVKFLTTISGGIDSTIIGIFIKKLKIFGESFFAISNKAQKEKNNSDSELEASYIVAKECNLNHRQIIINDETCLEDIKQTASTAFDGCVCSGTDNFAALARYLKKINYKVMMISDGADEFLGGYIADIEANKIDKLMSPGKPLSFLMYLTKFNLGKKLLSIASCLNLKKNKEFEFSYSPFYSRVNHSVCSDLFLNKVFKNYEMNKKYDYGLIDPIYSEITKKMDYSQIRALIYATKTLPDMFNMRLDKAAMRHSVEVRLPFQSISIAEMLIAMPNKYKFNNGQGKNFLREYIKDEMGERIAKRPKSGMGQYLWLNKKIREKLNFKDEINKSEFFEKFPFKKDIKSLLFKKNTHPANVWVAYCLSKTYYNLKKINKKKF